ncbi:hypothetical protein [Burkholderia sp. Bp8992]|uniref:hypothetical protein n=1 Tax=Burkholderia sp. Bp8992 TaxID=2184554 RepID=UPI0021AB1BD5|nr:hypothetical protein [Burkholderia sp. Bp8992]
MQFNASKIATIKKTGSRNAQGWRNGRWIKAAGRRLFRAGDVGWLSLSSDAAPRDGVGVRPYHPSVDIPTAPAVGARDGVPVMLDVDAQRTHLQDHTFFVAENGAWLTDAVPADASRRSTCGRAEPPARHHGQNIDAIESASAAHSGE